MGQALLKDLGHHSQLLRRMLNGVRLEITRISEDQTGMGSFFDISSTVRQAGRQKPVSLFLSLCSRRVFIFFIASPSSWPGGDDEEKREKERARKRIVI